MHGLLTSTTTQMREKNQFSRILQHTQLQIVEVTHRECFPRPNSCARVGLVQHSLEDSCFVAYSGASRQDVHTRFTKSGCSLKAAEKWMQFLGSATANPDHRKNKLTTTLLKSVEQAKRTGHRETYPMHSTTKSSSKSSE